MKVFLSWSGDYTRQIAEAFSEWLPCVLQTVETFVSSQDIGAGERWQSKINASLLEIDFGVIFITAENKEKPWIMFEAGSLAKNLDVSRVVPVLCETTELDLKGSPLLQFQYVKLEKEGVRNLVQGIFANSDDSRLTDGQLEGIFETWWSKLEGRIQDIERNDTADGKAASKPLSKDERMDRLENSVSDMLHLVRNLSKNARSGPSFPVVSRHDKERSRTVNSHRVEVSTKTFFEVPESDFYLISADFNLIIDFAKTEKHLLHIEKYLDEIKGEMTIASYRRRMMAIKRKRNELTS